MHYSWRRQIARGSLEEPSLERLLLAIAAEKVRVFGWKKEGAENAVANGGLLPMSNGEVLFMDWMWEMELGKKTEDEAPRSICVDEKWKSKGKEEFLLNHIGRAVCTRYEELL